MKFRLHEELKVYIYLLLQKCQCQKNTQDKHIQLLERHLLRQEKWATTNLFLYKK